MILAPCFAVLSDAHAHTQSHRFHCLSYTNIDTLLIVCLNPHHSFKDRPLFGVLWLISIIAMLYGKMLKLGEQKKEINKAQAK